MENNTHQELSKFSNYELLEELVRRSKGGELNYVVLRLLNEKKIDFLTISSVYTKHLETLNDDLNMQLTEANNCIVSPLIVESCKKDMSKEEIKKELDDNKQRSLYFLKMQNRFNIDKLLQELNYDEEKGRKLSKYKEGGNIDMRKRTLKQIFNSIKI